MTIDIYELAIEYIPNFLNAQIQSDSFREGIFSPLRDIINFDDAHIFFLNPDSISLKYSYLTNNEFSAGDVFYIDESTKNLLFSKEKIICDSNNEVIKLLKLDYKSFLIVKLLIRDTVFGFLIFAKDEFSYYGNEHAKIASVFASVIAYKIKDIELGDIFKAQLKALQEGLVQTKSAYKTIKDQNIKIMESDKIKNEFLANISHELRTPLNAIIGFSEMLSTQLFGKLNDKQAEYVNDIYISGIHLLGMINEILDISKIEAKAMTLSCSDFMVSQVINEVVNVIMPLISKKSIKININISEDKVIFADFQKLKQILYNLLSNSIKFSPKNSKIEVNSKFYKKKFILEVKDNGIGIDIKHHEKIFEKFVQLENAYTKTQSSTGLGLTITKELVEMHNGKIRVFSELGKGASFIVEIPLTNK